MDPTESEGADPGPSGLRPGSETAAGDPLPPVRLWNPPDRGDIGLKIDSNGVWFYRGGAIERPALSRLFSTLLRREPDGFYLVTPAEKVRVDVEDAPFVAVELSHEEGPAGPALRFRSNAGDWVVADEAHPLRFERDPHGGVKPYVKIRDDLWARLSRPLLFELIQCGEIREKDGERLFGVASKNSFFAIGPAEEVEDLA